MVNLKSRDVKTAKSFHELTEYIILDCEYQTQDRNRPNAFRPLQVSAIHYKNNKVYGKMLDVFLIEPNAFSLNDISRALSSYTGSSKSFARYMKSDGYSTALLEIYRWFKSKHQNVVPIIVVGNDCNEVTRLFDLINKKAISKCGPKIKTFDVYTIQSLISATLDVDCHRSIGLSTFQNELKYIDEQFNVNRDNNYHNSLNDVVMTYSLLQYLFVDTRTTALLKSAIQYMINFKEFVSLSTNSKKF